MTKKHRVQHSKHHAYSESKLGKYLPIICISIILLTIKKLTSLLWLNCKVPEDILGHTFPQSVKTKAYKLLMLPDVLLLWVTMLKEIYRCKAGVYKLSRDLRTILKF